MQCSNCGHTWFQKPQSDAEIESQPDAPAVEENLPETSDEPVTEPSDDTEENAPEEWVSEDLADVEIESDVEEPQSGDDVAEAVEELFEDNSADEIATDIEEPVAEPAPADIEEAVENVVDDATGEDDFEEDEGAPNAPIATKLPDDVRDILREEADLARSQRNAAGTLESQPELGIDAPAQDSETKAIRESIAKMDSAGDEADDPAALAALASGRRRDLLPDIEEINSTLSASSERDDDGVVHDEETLRERSNRRGFRWVFTLLVLLAVLAIVLYMFAPKIAEAVPQFAPLLESYVNAANDLRMNLDVMLENASERLTALLANLKGS
ncbi:zinc-ribbon domain-containing protein [Celeribacter arenosi]|uniref:Zinc-ribbon domain-containing protein n=1 Tax=Celeribacter arenosi TaxID=792649 RepID=A0ABP7K0S2_9RHOB